MSAEGGTDKRSAPAGGTGAGLSPEETSLPPDKTSVEPTPLLVVVLAWLVVGAPLAWGVFQTLKKAAALFA